jgi:hypothetical protein
MISQIAPASACGGFMRGQAEARARHRKTSFLMSFSMRLYVEPHHDRLN